MSGWTNVAGHNLMPEPRSNDPVGGVRIDPAGMLRLPVYHQYS